MTTKDLDSNIFTMSKSIEGQDLLSLADLKSNDSQHYKDKESNDILSLSTLNSPLVSFEKNELHASSLTEPFLKKTKCSNSYEERSLTGTKAVNYAKKSDSYNITDSIKDAHKIIEFSSPSKQRSKISTNSQTNNYHTLQRMKIKENQLEKELNKWKEKYHDQLQRRNQLVIENNLKSNEIEKMQKQIKILERHLKDSQIELERKEMELQKRKKYILQLEQHVSVHSRKKSKINANFQMETHAKQKSDYNINQNREFNVKFQSSPSCYGKENEVHQDIHLSSDRHNNENTFEKKIPLLHESKDSRRKIPFVFGNIDSFIQEEIDRLGVDDFIDA